MKSPEYVYMVVSLYRMAIDSYYKNGVVEINNNDLIKLKKIFNRNYTKGFLFNTDNNDLINGYRPNHMGVPVGNVVEYKNKIAKIKLIDRISIGSGLRVIGKNNDVGINVNDFYINNKLVEDIKKAKGKKQIIVVSHNATIPVLADAENIIYCKADGDKITIRSNYMVNKIFNKIKIIYNFMLK